MLGTPPAVTEVLEAGLEWSPDPCLARTDRRDRPASAGSPRPVTFDLAEAAAVLSSLTVLGPTATGSAGSAMQKLTAALTSSTLRRSPASTLSCWA